MPQFILGLPLTGKSTLIIEKVKELANNGCKSVIIVPEQASFATEKAVYNAIGDSFSLNVEILSFSRLYDEICRKTGGVAARTLNESDKIIFMSKALKQAANELKLWGKYSNSLNFAKKMLDTVGEFKIGGISSARLYEASKSAKSQTLSQKLSDLALIYETYDILTSERFIDPADKLTKLYSKLEDNRYFSGKTVFIDGFKGFTGQQFNIIDRILAQADNVYCAFTDDTSAFREYDIFTNIRSAKNKIEELANNHRIKIQEPVILNKSYYNCDSLRYLERLLCEKTEKGNCNDSLAICKANTIFDEADFAARTIKQLVINENLRFKDFAIITRDNEKYTPAVEYACLKNGVECFFDKKVSLLSFPLSVAVLSAIKATDLSTENILRFHKSGIGILSANQISELENYAYLWNISGDMWLKEWDMDVRGFVTEGDTKKTDITLEWLNQQRKRAIEPILAFKNDFSGTVSDMSKAIVKLIESCHISGALKGLCERFADDIFTTDVLKQSYDAFMNVLDSIVVCYNNAVITKSEYYDALNLALSFEEVGIIPQTLDQVIFGQADRIRPQSPKIVFILGANQGVFPQFGENKGIFANKERKELTELELNLSDNEIYTSIDEKFLVYCNLCSATDKLYICYSTSTLKGEKLEPSSFVNAIAENLNPQIFNEPQATLTKSNLPQTYNAAFSELCRRFNNKDDFETLKTVFNLEGKDGVSGVIDAANREKFTLSKSKAIGLYGNNITLSATKIDRFHRCKFSHFCEHGLRLKKLQPADFDVLQRGTIVHYVLEKIIGKYKENIKDLSKNELDKLCDDYIDEYLDSVKGFRSVQTARHLFLLSKISRSLKDVLSHLASEFAQSDFKPQHCELVIGGDEGVPLKFPFDGGEVSVEGKIDRVDTYNGYVRVIDYKTGSKTFKLPDIFFGLNLQMLLYLYAVTRASGLDDKSAAGIFYMQSKRDLNGDGKAMNGLMQSDENLVKAMDKENSGVFVPKISITQGGTVSKMLTSFITDTQFTEIFDHIEKVITKTGKSILNGEIDVSPIDGRESGACDYCNFKGMCGIEDKTVFKVPSLKNEEVFEKLAEEKENGI